MEIEIKICLREMRLHERGRKTIRGQPICISSLIFFIGWFGNENIGLCETFILNTFRQIWGDVYLP
jgi:hypothetical protein